MMECGRVVIVMDNAKLKLGVLKSPLGKAISVVHLRGFFLWRRHGSLISQKSIIGREQSKYRLIGGWQRLRTSVNRVMLIAYCRPTARQHLISYISQQGSYDRILHTFLRMGC